MSAVQVTRSSAAHGTGHSAKGKHTHQHGSARGFKNAHAMNEAFSRSMVHARHSLHSAHRDQKGMWVITLRF